MKFCCVASVQSRSAEETARLSQKRSEGLREAVLSATTRLENELKQISSASHYPIEILDAWKQASCAHACSVTHAALQQACIVSLSLPRFLRAAALLEDSDDDSP